VPEPEWGCHGSPGGTGVRSIKSGNFFGEVPGIDRSGKNQLLWMDASDASFFAAPCARHSKNDLNIMH
jgi:hypothetical protein